MKKVSLLFMLMLSFVLCDAKPKIQFYSYEYDFGEIKEADGKVTYKFEFRNVGNKDLILTEVKYSCGCLVANYSKNSIAPSQSGFIEAIYNSYRRPGKFIKGFEVKTNEPKFSESSGEQPYILSVYGTVEGLTEAERANDIAKTESSQVGATSAHDFSFNFPKSVTFELGKTLCTDYPYSEEDKKIFLKVEYNAEKGRISYYLLGARYSDGRYTHFGSGISSCDFVDGQGRKVTTDHEYYSRSRSYSYFVLLNKCDGDKLFVQSVEVWDQIGRTPFPRRVINVNKEILPFNSWKEDYAFNKAIKGNLQDAISYLRNCKYDNLRNLVESRVLSDFTSSINNIVYINENYPSLKEKLANSMLSLISSVSDCKKFMTCYSSSHANEAETALYNVLKDSQSASDVDAFLEIFPNGEHASYMKNRKMEFQYWEKAKDGTISDCAAYLSKFPTGNYVSEVKARKQYLEGVQTNSNKALWKMGNKICHCNTSGITMVTLDQWNEDKSSFKGIVVASPGGLYEGNILQKGNMLWLEPKGWHKCLEEEVSYALENDKSAEAEKLLSERNMKFRRGTMVSYQCSSRGFLGLYNNYYNIIAKVEDWNEDFTKMKIQIVKTDGVGKFDGEDIYEGKYIWVSPIGWK